MERVNYTWIDGDTDDYDAPIRTGWFDLGAAKEIAEDTTRWDGHNRISLATGTEWTRETLLQTAGGRYMIERRNRDGRGGNVVGTTYHPVDEGEAVIWLRKNGHHYLADEIGGLEPERGPGRPRIGTRRTVVVPDDLWGKLTARAIEQGHDVSTELRAVLSTALD